MVNAGSEGLYPFQVRQRAWIGQGISRKQDFKILVRIYLDLGKGWIKVGSANITGTNSVDMKDVKLPAPAKRAAICAMNDVLALSIQNSK